MKQVYLVMLASDDPCYPDELMGVYASEMSAEAQVSAYVSRCAQRNGLPVDHEDFWDIFPQMYLAAHELFE